MKVQYDNDIDALYLQLSEKDPNGVVELTEGINLDTTSDGKLSGIEILNASEKVDLETLLSYNLELDPSLFKRKSS